MHIKKQRHYFVIQGLSNQGYGLSSGHGWMWELDYKESWALKNWYFWTVVLEKTLESPLDCKEIQPVHPKGDQSWVFIGRTDAEAETPVLWTADTKNWLTWKDPDAGKDWRQEEKGTTEDEMVGRHHLFNWHEFSRLWELVMDRETWVLQSMGLQKVGDDWVTELNWTELNWSMWECLKGKWTWGIMAQGYVSVLYYKSVVSHIPYVYSRACFGSTCVRSKPWSLLVLAVGL